MDYVSKFQLYYIKYSLLSIVYVRLKVMQTLKPDLLSRLQEFDDIFGEELDDCNPNAHDLFKEVMEKQDFQLLDDFIYYHIDELDACHEEAFEFLYQLGQDYNIPM